MRYKRCRLGECGETGIEENGGKGMNRLTTLLVSIVASAWAAYMVYTAALALDFTTEDGVFMCCASGLTLLGLMMVVFAVEKEAEVKA